MEQVTAFKSRDGVLFCTQEACEEHEISLLWQTKIDDFQESRLNPYPRGAHVGMVRKTIVAWERFKIDDEPTGEIYKSAEALISRLEKELAQ